MIEHGIFNSVADYWIHLFPLDGFVYWYSVPVMQEYIRIKNLQLIDAASLDGSITGKGYLIEKHSPYRLIASAPVSDYFKADSFDWEHATPREAGRRAQMIVENMLWQGTIKLPFYRVERENNREEQFKGYDGHIRYFAEVKYETKCERLKSSNLFVQQGELGHKATLARDSNGNLVERWSPLGAA